MSVPYHFSFGRKKEKYRKQEERKKLDLPFTRRHKEENGYWKEKGDRDQVFHRSREKEGGKKEGRHVSGLTGV